MTPPPELSAESERLQPSKPHFNEDSVLRKLAARNPGSVRIFHEGEIADALKKEVVGQDSACHEIDQLYSIGAARESGVKPICAVFLAGPPGTGKSFIVETLHKFIANTDDIRSLLFVDCGKLKNADTGMTYLFGVASAYKGSEDGGLISRGIQDNPRALVLFDEFEKADKRIQESLLVALNSGFVEDLVTRQKIPVKNTAWFFTTNKNQRALQPLMVSTTKPFERSDILKNNYINSDFLSPEFADRIDSFLWLDKLSDRHLVKMIGNVIKIAILEFDSRFHLEQIDEDAVVHLYDALENSSGGTRELKRIVSKSVQGDLLRFKREGNTSGKISVKYDNGTIRAVYLGSISEME